MLLIFNSLDSKQNNKIFESEDAKINSILNRLFEDETREKEEAISKKVFGALFERRIDAKVLNLHYCSIAN